MYEPLSEEMKKLKAELASLKEQIVDLTERNQNSGRGIHVCIGPVSIKFSSNLEKQ